MQGKGTALHRQAFPVGAGRASEVDLHTLGGSVDQDEPERRKGDGIPLGACHTGGQKTFFKALQIEARRGVRACATDDHLGLDTAGTEENAQREQGHIARKA